MKNRDMIELAARNLRQALLRNFLTTIGIAVGVASLVAMLSLGAGLQGLASQKLSQSGLFNAIFVAPRVPPPRFGAPPNADVSPAAPPRSLDDDARLAIERLPGVAEVYPEIRFATEIHFADGIYATVVAGIPNSARSDGAFDGMTGTFFSSPDADEAILQISLARQLSTQPRSLLGQQIVLRYAERQPLPADPAPGNSAGGSPGFSLEPREQKLRIVGIVETEPAGGFGGIGRGRLLIPLGVAEKLGAAQAADLRDLLRDPSAPHRYANLTVRVERTSRVRSVEDSIKQMGFATYSLLDATRDLRLVFAVFDLLLGIFGSLALVVASLGIVNTLVMAILERRREIGVFKALGAADRDIRRLFFAEAGTMGLLGGVFGVLLGWLIGRGINFGTNIYLARRALPAVTISLVPIWMVISAIAFSVGVSLLAGMYPAARAAQLDPIEALRYE